MSFNLRFRDALHGVGDFVAGFVADVVVVIVVSVVAVTVVAVISVALVAGIVDVVPFLFSESLNHIIARASCRSKSLYSS